MKRRYAAVFSCNKLNSIIIFVICLILIYYILSSVFNQDVILESDWQNGKISLSRANQIYKNCCVSVKLEKGCLEACRYDLTLTLARQIFFENQDHNTCDLDESIERFVKCANGMKKHMDSQQREI
uniref:Uncharacterized protein n=1 Tax=Romanomermis culicivorax TaxID=13658 RepID=A0A915L8G5_ROMCU